MSAVAAASAASPEADGSAAGGFAQAIERAALRLATVTAAAAAAHRPPDEDDKSMARKLDLAKTSSMDVEALNTLVVQLRKFVRMAKVRTIHKLARDIKKLRNRKGTDEQNAKNAAKAERLGEEIVVMKAANIDRISKFALSNTLTMNDVHKQKQPSAHLRALTRLAEHESLRERVQHWRSEHTDWEELGAFLLAKNTGRRFRKKKLKATALTKELNRELLKETIKKAAKEVGGALPDLVGADEASDDGSGASSSSRASDASASASLAAGSSDGSSASDSDVDDATDGGCDYESDDGQSAAAEEAALASAPAVSGVAHALSAAKSEERIRGQRKDRGRVGLLEQAAAAQQPAAIGGKGERPQKKQRGGKDTADAAAKAPFSVRSGDMVVARIDLSTADFTASGECIAMPTAVEAAAAAAECEEAAADAAATSRGDEASRASAAPAAKKKKSSFFMRADCDEPYDDDDDDGGDADGSKGEERVDTDGSSDDDDDEARDAYSTQATRSHRSAPDRSVFVSSLHGLGHRGSSRGRSQSRSRGGGSDQGHMSERPYRGRGGGQASRFSKNVGVSWPRGAAKSGDAFGHRHAGGGRPDPRGKPPLFGRAGSAGGSSRHHPVARTAGPPRPNGEPAKPAEKLHPSWEASKKRKAMEKLASQPFCGKKIKFDDD